MKATFSQVRHPSHPGRGCGSLTCHMTHFEQSDWLRSPNLTNIMIEYLNQWWLVYRRIYASLGLNELAMELRLPCIKPMKLYSVDGNRSIRRSYKSDAKGVKQGYFSFLGTATLSEATEQAVFSGYTCGCHIGKTNKDAASGHEMATIMSRFSEWLL